MPCIRRALQQRSQDRRPETDLAAEPEPEGRERRNERAPMQYRRFGRTNRALSVITLGGMRYDDDGGSRKHGVPKRMLDECRDSVTRALELGVNHIETAYGYGKSERCYGIVLEELKIPRDRYFFMTKGAPSTGDDQ